MYDAPPHNMWYLCDDMLFMYETVLCMYCVRMIVNLCMLGFVFIQVLCIFILAVEHPVHPCCEGHYINKLYLLTYLLTYK